MAYFFTRILMYPLMRLLFVKQITGANNLPKKTPYILAANHASYIDGVLMFLTILWYKNKPVHILIYKEFFKTWFKRLIFLTWYKQMQANHSVDHAVQYLINKELVGIFPEGGRTHTGKIKKVTHSGLAVMALETGLPVVPIGIEGTYELWSRYQKWPKFKRLVTIRIGKPMKFNLAMNKKNYKTVTSKVMKSVAKLVKEEYKW
ncbi:1-acyl-sn-glycerol-3-phosphate acyltransferase [Candidatus Woesearchaeota archaeon]|nr:1-acyl-sn-glycerol-3-phosphate acyltransferase [Candidatus Woesearchaeota archaeon]